MVRQINMQRKIIATPIDEKKINKALAEISDLLEEMDHNGSIRKKAEIAATFRDWKKEELVHLFEKSGHAERIMVIDVVAFGIQNYVSPVFQKALVDMYTLTTTEEKPENTLHVKQRFRIQEQVDTLSRQKINIDPAINEAMDAYRAKFFR